MTSRLPPSLAISPISTHTLTWSVTALVDALTATEQDFNSHAHVERDDKRILIDGGLCDFNSHAHVERDWLRVAHTGSA